MMLLRGEPPVRGQTPSHRLLCGPVDDVVYLLLFLLSLYELRYRL